MERSLRSELLERAAELGAIAVRVTDASADRQAQQRLRASFTRGDLATWPYDATYARAASHPRDALADARSLVCVAVPYATAEPKRGPLTGRVSNYAWSTDYHTRMRTLLADLAAIVDARAGRSATRIFCDTFPLAERAFAARAGLGWVGKHTNLIHPELGSFVFLGEIVTDVFIEPDEPLRKSCGECRRCVDVCPTRALRGDYTIDATRCIADLTQRTTSIPRELRPLIGDWVWGCDLCQLACPPTRRAGMQGAAGDAPVSSAVAAPSLTSLLALRSSAFKRLYRRSALGWRGAAVLRRNAAVALGNALDRSSAGALAASLERDPHPMVREHAAWALGRIGSPAALRTLRGRQTLENDEIVRAEIALSLEPFSGSGR